MSKTADETTRGADGRSYWDRSEAPLPSLIVLAPLILFYEVGLLLLGAAKVRAFLNMEGPQQDVTAHFYLYKMFQWLGASGYYLPGLGVVAALLGWHIVKRDPWRVNLRLIGLMWIESLALALPLFVFAMIFAGKMMAADSAAGESVGAVAVVPLASSVEADALPGGAEAIVLSIGAGIYEEMLFRLIGIALLHMIFVDWLKCPEKWGTVLVVALTAFAFAMYHDPFAAGGRRGAGRFIFYTCAGVYFAVIYLLRGFGIVACAHALYDVLAFVQGVLADAGSE